MAKIPTAASISKTVPQSANAYRISGEAAEGLTAPARAQQNLGRTIANVGEQWANKFQSEADKRAEYEAERSMLDFDLETDRRINESTKSMQPGGKGFADTLDRDFDTRAREFMKTVPESQRQRVDAELQRRHANVVKRARDTEIEESDRFETKRLDEGLQDSLGKVEANPDLLEEKLANAERLVDLAPISERQRAELKSGRNSIRNRLYMAQIQGRLTRALNPPSGRQEDINVDEVERLKLEIQQLGDIDPETARFSGGPRFTPEVENAITKAVTETGVPEAYLRGATLIESSGDPNARTGKYAGLLMLSEEEFKRYGGKNIMDPVENARVAALKIKDDMAAFEKKFGRKPTPADLYLVHNQGMGGYEKHIQNPDKPAWENMASTAEGRKEGEEWSKKAIWDNLTPEEKAKYKRVEDVKSKDFVEFWKKRVSEKMGEGGVRVTSQKNGNHVVTAASGAKFAVAPAYSDRFAGLIRDLEAEGIHIKGEQSGGFNDRNIAGTNVKSRHAFAEAIDINWDENAQFQKGGSLVKALGEDKIREIARRNGLKWGGDFSEKRRDEMHFEVDRGGVPRPMAQRAMTAGNPVKAEEPQEANPALEALSPFARRSLAGADKTFTLGDVLTDEDVAKLTAANKDITENMTVADAEKVLGSFAFDPERGFRVSPDAKYKTLYREDRRKLLNVIDNELNKRLADARAQIKQALESDIKQRGDFGVAVKGDHWIKARRFLTKNQIANYELQGKAADFRYEVVHGQDLVNKPIWERERLLKEKLGLSGEKDELDPMYAVKKRVEREVMPELAKAKERVEKDPASEAERSDNVKAVIEQARQQKGAGRMAPVVEALIEQQKRIGVPSFNMKTITNADAERLIGNTRLMGERELSAHYSDVFQRIREEYGEEYAPVVFDDAVSLASRNAEEAALAGARIRSILDTGGVKPEIAARAALLRGVERGFLDDLSGMEVGDGSVPPPEGYGSGFDYARQQQRNEFRMDEGTFGNYLPKDKPALTKVKTRAEVRDPEALKKLIKEYGNDVNFIARLKARGIDPQEYLKGR